MNDQPDFKYGLKQSLILIESGEIGVCIGRAQYAHAEDSYYIRYKAADGRACECWWGESALQAA